MRSYRFWKSTVPYYYHMLVIIDVGRKSLEKSKKLQPIYSDGRLLQDYYTHKRVQWIEYITDHKICLVFNDELLVLGVGGGSQGPFARLMIIKLYSDSVFERSSNGIFRLKRPSRNEKVVEFVSKDAIREVAEDLKKSKEKLEQQRDVSLNLPVLGQDHSAATANFGRIPDNTRWRGGNQYKKRDH